MLGTDLNKQVKLCQSAQEIRAELLSGRWDEKLLQATEIFLRPEEKADVDKYFDIKKIDFDQFKKDLLSDTEEGGMLRQVIFKKLKNNGIFKDIANNSAREEFINTFSNEYTSVEQAFTPPQWESLDPKDNVKVVLLNLEQKFLEKYFNLEGFQAEQTDNLEIVKKRKKNKQLGKQLKKAFSKRYSEHGVSLTAYEEAEHTLLGEAKQGKKYLDLTDTFPSKILLSQLGQHGSYETAGILADEVLYQALKKQYTPERGEMVLDLFKQGKLHNGKLLSILAENGKSEEVMDFLEDNKDKPGFWQMENLGWALAGCAINGKSEEVMDFLEDNKDKLGFWQMENLGDVLQECAINGKSEEVMSFLEKNEDRPGFWQMENLKKALVGCILEGKPRRVLQLKEYIASKTTPEQRMTLDYFPDEKVDYSSFREKTEKEFETLLAA